MDSARVARVRMVAVLFLVTATVAAFWPVLHNDFLNYDDGAYVTENLHVQTGFNATSLAWAWTTFHEANWHPLTWMSHILDWRLFGPHPGGHHLTSLLLHSLNAVLLLLAFERMTGSLGRSACLAGLFALHPLHVESVAWVAERKDVLSTFFWFLAIWVYADYARNPRRPRLIVVAVLLAAGLCAKPMLVTAPLTLLLLDVWPLRRPVSFSARVREKAALFGLAAASGVVTLVAQRAGKTVVSLGEYSLVPRLLNAPVFCFIYLRKALWPRALAIFYPHPGGLLPVWQVAAAAAALAGLTALAWRVRRGRPYALAGWLWFLVTLTPVIGIVQVGEQAVADRYTYVPLVGVFVIAVWGLPEACRALVAWVRRAPGPPAPRRWDAALLAPAAIVGIVLGVCTFRQAERWRDSETLFRHTLSVAEDNPVAHLNLGVALERQDRLDEASSHLRAAVRLAPQNPLALLNLGVVVGRQGRVDEAVALLREAVRLRPTDPVALLDLGTALSKQGRMDEAGRQFSRALEIDPSLAVARVNLGFVLAQRGRLDEAAAQFEEALRRQPDFAEAHRHYAAVLVRQGQVDHAIVHLRRATEIQPAFGEAHFDLATLLFRQGDVAEAWRAVQRARRSGFSPPPAFVEQLRAKAPEPPY